MRIRYQIEAVFVMAIVLQSFALHAEFSVAQIFGDNMVLQRNEPIIVWGWGTPGENLEISLDAYSASTVIDNEGKWRVALPAMKAGGPYGMSIKGASEIQFENILIGDVWLCSGQSNMEWRVRQTPYEEQDDELIKSNRIRMFTVQIEWDCLPADDIAGGEWKNMGPDNIRDFSAVAYHFGRALNADLDVPIGLINSSLGATYIETWMSNEALMDFEQFEPDIAPVLEHGMDYATMKSTFEEKRSPWESEHYLKGPGIEGNWHLPSTDRSDWGEIEVPGYWDAFGLAEHDGAVWYAKEFDLPQDFNSAKFMLQLNQIRDYDITWVNGVKVGETYGRRNHRTYFVDSTILKPQGNTLVVRAFDTGGPGGFTTSAFWGNPVLLGKWKFRKGLEIDAADFPKVIMPNASPFSTPAVLFNANIAPLAGLPITGAIWYQGESNAGRAYEYRDLLPAMIRDWRKHWGGRDFPFLIVQLANYMQADMMPAESGWAELREAQYRALNVPNTGIACIIDIGEANDIHPRNKEDVGRRLALSAEKVAYGKDVVFSGPTMQAINYLDDEIRIYFANVGDGLMSSQPGKNIGGFAVAGDGGDFRWADAFIADKNVVVIPDPHGLHPKFIRYAWANNPVQVSLYNSEGLPALPFRTDDLRGETYGVKYNYKDDGF